MARFGDELAATAQAGYARTRADYAASIGRVVVHGSGFPAEPRVQEAVAQAMRERIPAEAEGFLSPVANLGNADELSKARDVVTRLLQDAAGSSGTYRCEVMIGGHAVRSFHPAWDALA